jgi:hypothetical protein
METKMTKQNLNFSSKNKALSMLLASSVYLFSVNGGLANQEEKEEHYIKVHPKSFEVQKKEIRNLIVPYDIEGIEYLAVLPKERKLIVFQKNKEPQEIEPTYYPSSFPWGYSPEKIDIFLRSQSIVLKKLGDESFKIDMHTSGLGGGNSPSQPSSNMNWAAERAYLRALKENCRKKGKPFPSKMQQRLNALNRLCN